jgi:hypothetical protein
MCMAKISKNFTNFQGFDVVFLELLNCLFTKIIYTNLGKDLIK